MEGGPPASSVSLALRCARVGKVGHRCQRPDLRQPQPRGPQGTGQLHSGPAAAAGFGQRQRDQPALTWHGKPGLIGSDLQPSDRLVPGLLESAVRHLNAAREVLPDWVAAADRAVRAARRVLFCAPGERVLPLARAITD
jgi:hypothetical protein